MNAVIQKPRKETYYNIPFFIYRFIYGYKPNVTTDNLSITIMRNGNKIRRCERH